MEMMRKDYSDFITQLLFAWQHYKSLTTCQTSTVQMYYKRQLDNYRVDFTVNATSGTNFNVFRTFLNRILQTKTFYLQHRQENKQKNLWETLNRNHVKQLELSSIQITHVELVKGSTNFTNAPFTRSSPHQKGSYWWKEKIVLSTFEERSLCW